MICYNGVVITNLVMTFSKLSPTGEYAVSSCQKGFHDKERIDPASAHDPYGPDVGRILKTGDAGGISRRIAAPVAEKAQYFWFERFFRCHIVFTVLKEFMVCHQVFIESW
jgi:hypothetical protein